MAGLLNTINNALFGKDKEDEVDIDQIPPSDLVIDEDCSSCPMPCDDHKQYPSYLQFDRESKLLGSMKPYGRHFLISTGVTDWSEKIEEDTGTLAANLSDIIKSQNKTEWRNFITNTSMTEQYSTLQNTHDVLVLPDNIIVANVRDSDAQAFFDGFVNKPLPTRPVEDLTTLDYKDMKVHKNPYRSMILICSHKKRDKRCGVTAPILSKEFEGILRDKDMGEDDAAIFMVSHVGGHKFAGNVICYINEGRTGIWYGRVNTCHCKAIVEDTLLNGKVIKELYRGAMSHSFDSSKCERLRW